MTCIGDGKPAKYLYNRLSFKKLLLATVYFLHKMYIYFGTLRP